MYVVWINTLVYYKIRFHTRCNKKTKDTTKTFRRYEPSNEKLKQRKIHAPPTPKEHNSLKHIMSPSLEGNQRVGCS